MPEVAAISLHFRRTTTSLKKVPVNELVYQFVKKKRSEGKPYFVYMTAAQNKLLRIHYACVKECFMAFDACNTAQE